MDSQHALLKSTGAEKSLNWVPLLDQPLHVVRKLRLVCVSAGFCGLILAHKIKYDLKMDDFIQLQIYEKNPDVGGAWYENRYPGAARDVPARESLYYFVMAARLTAHRQIPVFPFEPNPNWTSFYACGPEIWRYMKDTSVNGKWKLSINQLGNVIEDECDIFVNASGFLNKWSWPNISRLHDFKGKLLHTTNW
ncbi:hypothetical protein NCS52_00895700 [Fusarium sp. LHS14.1]|nr:hypothetical protein NCS52_00895700 [Fusarium sp. LHS14.1]